MRSAASAKDEEDVMPLGNTITVVPSNIMGNVIQSNEYDPLLQEICDNTGDPWACGVSQHMLNRQDNYV